MWGNWVSGTPEPIPREEDCLCLTDFRPIHIPAMRTRGMPIPSPTPRPTLTVPVLEPVLGGDAGTVSKLFWLGVLKGELAVVLGVEEVDDVKAVDELELDGLELDEL